MAAARPLPSAPRSASERKPFWTGLDDARFEDPSHTAADFQVLGFLKKWARLHPGIVPTLTRVAKHIHRCVQTVRRSYRRLAAAGHILIARTAGGQMYFAGMATDPGPRRSGPRLAPGTTPVVWREIQGMFGFSEAGDGAVPTLESHLPNVTSKSPSNVTFESPLEVGPYKDVNTEKETDKKTDPGSVFLGPLENPQEVPVGVMPTSAELVSEDVVDGLVARAESLFVNVTADEVEALASEVGPEGVGIALGKAEERDPAPASFGWVRAAARKMKAEGKLPGRPAPQQNYNPPSRAETRAETRADWTPARIRESIELGRVAGPEGRLFRGSLRRAVGLGLVDAGMVPAEFFAPEKTPAEGLSRQTTPPAGWSP